LADVRKPLEAATAIDEALVDFASGVCLDSKGGGTLDMELAGAAATEITRTKKQRLDNIGLAESIDEITVEFEEQYHLI
jgi:hypothetical protein